MKCRQATRLISDTQERSLMTKEKIGLNLHLADVYKRQVLVQLMPLSIS